MSHQCVPSWDLEDDSPPIAQPTPPLLLKHKIPLPSAAAAASSAAVFTDYEVAELTWKDGNLAMLGLRHPQRISKKTLRYPSPSSAASAAAAGGTLECIVDQARGSTPSPDLLYWLGGAHDDGPVDALVPCSDQAAGMNCVSQGSAAPATFAAAAGNKESTLVTVDTCELAAGETEGIGFSGTPSGSPPSAEDQAEGGGSAETENRSFVGTRSLGVDDHDSVGHCLRSQEALGEIGMTSMSRKRSRVAAVHNHYERKRRDRINEKMKTLQKLLPSSIKFLKTDKASMLDEVIEYMKLLQAQVHVMSTMSPMMLPITLHHQQLQISMMAQMAQMARMSHMSMGLGLMDPTLSGHIGLAPHPPPPPMLHPSAFLPSPASAAQDARATNWMQQPGGRVFPDMFSAFTGCPTQQQTMNSEAYNRMAALYQQLYGYNKN